MKTRRVVITGLGVVSPLGLDLQRFWYLLCEGRSGIRPITRFDPAGLSSTLAAEVEDFDPTDFIQKKHARRMGRASQFAVASSLMAMHDAQLNLEWEDRERIGVAMGSSIAGLKEALDAHADYMKKDCRHFNPFTMTATFPNAISGEVAIALGLHGHSETYSNGCSSTANAIGRAYNLIQHGEASVMLAGGADAPIHHAIMSAMDAGLMLASDEGGTIRDLPRPFDRRRCGTVLGEGGGCVVLEDYEHAISRGARIYAEIEGWSFTCDAFSMARPESTGKEQTRSIRKSLVNAQWFPEEVDYINACGLGTHDLDLIEVNAIKAGLGQSAHKVPVSSLKAALGHAFAASGAFQVVGTALALKHQMIPPTLNLKDPDPSCDLDFVTDIGRPAVVDRALVNSFGFGGKNIVLALSNPNRSVLPDDDRVRRTAAEEPMLVGAVYAGAGQA